MTQRTAENYFGQKDAVTGGKLQPTEVVECPLCKRSPTPFATDYQGFQLCRCAGCGLEFVSPRLSFDELADKVYADNYFPVRDASAKRSEEATAYFGGQVRRFEKLLGRTGTVLDIGCGNGAFLDFARENGWEIAGADIGLSPDAHTLGCPLWEGRLQDIDFEGCLFDVIRLNHVLEHTQEPVKELEICRRLLTPGGILYISVPNIAGLSPRLKSLQSRLHLKSHRWRHYAAMHHLFFFTPVTLRAAIERAGLRVLEWDTPVPKKTGQNLLLERVYRAVMQNTNTASILDFYCTNS